MKTLSRILCLVLAIAVLLPSIPVFPSAEEKSLHLSSVKTEGTVADESTFSVSVLDASTVEITAYLGAEEDIYIPSSITIDGTEYTVVKLADHAFENCNTLNSVTLGATITEIGSRTFYNCKNLVCIVTNDSLSVIGNEAFFGCDAFNSVVFQDSVISIGFDAFAECPALTVWCNEGSFAYVYCETRSIPCELIQENAEMQYVSDYFYEYYIVNGEATAIERISGSSSSISLPASVKGYPVTGLEVAYSSMLTEADLPNTLKRIGNDVFNYCPELKEIKIPDGVEYIGASAFEECRSLASVHLPESLRIISEKAFYRCYALPTLTLPDRLESIGDYAFYYCNSLKSISIPTGIRSLGKGVFKDSTRLKSVSFSEGILSIDAECFLGCSSLSQVFLPKSLSNIKNDSFPLETYLFLYSDCPAVEPCLKNGARYLFYNGTEEPIFTTAGGIDYCISAGEAAALKSNGSTTIPDTVNGYPVTAMFNVFENVGMKFSGMTSVTLSKNLKRIGSDAFKNCGSLSSVNLPDSVTAIQKEAFFGCVTLSSIRLPKNLTYIGANAFQSCTKLKTVTERATSLKTVEAGAFASCPLTSFYLPADVTYVAPDAFQYNTLLTVDENGNARQFVNDKASRYIVAPNGYQSVTSNGISYYVNGEEAAAYAYSGQGKVASFPERVNDVPVTAFLNVFGENDGTVKASALSSVSFPNQLKQLGSNAFRNCISLTSVTLPDSLLRIEQTAFYGCTSLQEVSLSEKIEFIGSEAFGNCPKLLSLYLPQSITHIAPDAFSHDLTLLVNEGSYAHRFAEENGFSYLITDGNTVPEALTENGICYLIANSEAVVVGVQSSSSANSVTIPETAGGYPVTTLLNAFGYHDDNVKFSNLTGVILPNTLKRIGINAFRHCISLSSIQIPQSVERIEKNAFYGCTSLTAINLSENLLYLGEGAFYGCKKLSELTLGSKLETIENDCFEGCNKLEKVIIPESVKAIDEKAFPGSTLLLAYENTPVHAYMKENGMRLLSLKGNEPPLFIVAGAFKYCITGGEAVAYDVTSTSISSATVPATVNGYPVAGLVGTFGGDGGNIKTPYLKSVSLPEGIRFVGPYTFYNCYAMEEISIPDTVTEIGSYAFHFCRDLKSISLPEKLNTIGIGAFSDCWSITELELPNSLTKLSSESFANCRKLKSVILPDTVRSIGSRAFASCQSLLSIPFTAALTEIGESAFYDCRSLKSLIFPRSLNSIGENAFYNVWLPRFVIIPLHSTLFKNSFSPQCTLLVYEESEALAFCEQNAVNHIIIRSENNNPEIHFGTEIGGTVSYNDYSNANDVTVTLLYRDGTEKASVTTDENGYYSFAYAEVGRYLIVATDAQGNSAHTTVSVKRMNAFEVFLSGDSNLVLKKTYSVGGTVGEANVNIFLKNEKGDIIATTVTDENGSFTLENIPNGNYLITAETENRLTTKELTVAGSNVEGLSLFLPKAEKSVTVSGYAIVEDRDQTYRPKEWIEVLLYDAEGILVSTCRTDENGAFRFAGLNTGEYSIVAQTEEMRTDPVYGYQRMHTLTGFGHVSATEAGEYQTENVILREESVSENGNGITLSGKVTAKGSAQVSQVTLQNVFHQEIAVYQTKNNGKFTFNNVADGLYFITAVTESQGFGFSVVTVKDGTVYGETHIFVEKSDRVTEREIRFREELSAVVSRSDAEAFRNRIMEEKEYFDSLSKKEQNQFSQNYVDTLTQFCEWLTDCTYVTEEGVTVEQGGLAINSDELEKDTEISFKVTVEKLDAPFESETGIHSQKDYVQKDIKNKAGKKKIQQYYEISMTKNVDGVEKEIASVFRDTDTNASFRITMPIPEEYKGYRNYSVIHVHNGESITLVDLDDDPDTITFEVNGFSSFVLTATDEFLIPEEEELPALRFSGASLSLQHNLVINYKVDSTLFKEGGYESPYVEFMMGGKTTTVSTYREEGNRYVFSFRNIAPDQIGDTVQAVLYATYNGELCASQPKNYSVSEYCYSMLNLYGDDGYAELRTLLVDLLEYGAASQNYTNYKLHLPVTHALTETEKSWGTQETPNPENHLDTRYKVIEKPEVNWKGASLILKDSISVRLRFQTENVTGLTLKIQTDTDEWVFPYSQFGKDDSSYYLIFNGLNAGQLSTPLFLTLYRGDTPVSNTVRYSVESYVYIEQNSSNPKLANLVISMLKYGDSAYAYAN